MGALNNLVYVGGYADFSVKHFNAYSNFVYTVSKIKVFNRHALVPFGLLDYDAVSVLFKEGEKLRQN